MNKWIGIALALTALIGGGLLYGWQGLVLGVTIVSFWLLLQFSEVRPGTLDRSNAVSWFPLQSRSVNAG